MCCFSTGSLLEVIEMKTMLSTPRTISKKMSVTSEIHASGVVKIDKSMVLLSAGTQKEHDP